MFKITRDTKPADVMLEGRPDVEIVAFGPRAEYNGPGTIYVYAKRADGIAGWDGGTAHAKQWGYKLNDGSATFRSVTCTEDGQCAWGRIVPRNVFRLTKDTDPATVMFEGYPDVTIDHIAPAGKNEVYVVGGSAPPNTRFGLVASIGKGNNHAHDESGKDTNHNSNNIWPRVVQRAAFDPTKPFHAVSDMSGEIYRYDLDATIIPADGSETIYRVRRGKGEINAGITVEVSARTGKVFDPRSAGGALTFTNGPTITTHRGLVNGINVVVVVTMTDGQPTAVELI